MTKHIHVRTWSGSCTATITDMTNAGKRGKRCRTLRFSGPPWNGGSDLQKLAAQRGRTIYYEIENLNGETFDEAADKIRGLVAEARAEGIPEGYIAVYDKEIRGVDAPVPVLTHCIEDVFSVKADNSGVCLSALNDPYNEWTEITSRQKAGQAYRLAAKVWSEVQACKTLSEASGVLRNAGCKLHGYCAMD